MLLPTTEIKTFSITFHCFVFNRIHQIFNTDLCNLQAVKTCILFPIKLLLNLICSGEKYLPTPPYLSQIQSDHVQHCPEELKSLMR